MKILVGETGLVGTTLKEKIDFDHLFNTKNINNYYNNNFDGSDLYLSCLPASKWVVNNDIQNDIENLYKLINIFSHFKYNNIFLISTIDVYCDSPNGSDENYNPNVRNLNYGSNRLLFENLVKQILTYKNLKIFRLPALFNKHIKKNILFDLLNNNNIELINSNSSYQWYNLDNLSNDIKYYREKFPNEILINLFTEPIDTEEILNFFPTHKNLVNYNDNKIVYNYKTKFHSSGYMKNKIEIITEIKKFINDYISK